jgi:hypothetical protein
MGAISFRELVPIILTVYIFVLGIALVCVTVCSQAEPSGIHQFNMADVSFIRTNIDVLVSIYFFVVEIKIKKKLSFYFLPFF